MFERGGLGKFWRRRWFIFEEEALRSFKLKEDKEPTGVIFFSFLFSPPIFILNLIIKKGYHDW